MFCRCGCGAVTTIAKVTDKRYGSVKGEHVAYLKGHSRKGRTEGDEARLARYSTGSDNGCILWTGAVDRDGYGIFSPYKQKTKRVTRFVYEKHNGEIPSNVFVCHTCDNPTCINPEHLFSGTTQDNMDDMKAKSRQSKGAKHPNATLSDKDVLRLRSLSGKLTQSEIADIFGVSQATVSNLIHNNGRKVA